MKRVQLCLKDCGAFVLTGRDGSKEWSKEFPSLFQALEFAHALNPEEDVGLTVTDSNGREVMQTLV
jgi:hypothetical protein